MQSKTNNNGQLYWFFLIFFLSGFSGLIYESIWSRYLKLFLGTSAFAQMLVIIIFMGGMAVGSGLAAKYSMKIKNLILLYGICELIIGFFGLGFHSIFSLSSASFYDLIAPNLDSSLSVTAAKFGVAALIIMPQSILLGATFPLISSGIIRKWPNNSGKTISTLYFLNSIGGAIGVLSSAFFFIPKIGLPGAAMSSGVINITLGLVVYRLTKNDSYKPIAVNQTIKRKPFDALVVSLLVLSLVTGLASFMYEIAWIRMLSMVLGASTDAFEIMLSVFILGLALGALFIKNRISQLKNPIIFLAGVQIVMGLLATLTIFFYNYSFDLLVFFLDAIKRNASGYLLYNLISILISMLIMLPATICAGTTLPLITHILLSKEDSTESAIGRVYSLNTIGAIIGVLMAVFLVMPNLGLKYVIVIGATCDLLMGVYLYHRYSTHSVKKKVTLVSPIIVVMLTVFTFIGLDYSKMSSGVFRSGHLLDPIKSPVISHQDGMISTVVVRDVHSKNGKVRIVSNNGKPDAGVGMDGFASADEPTMYLLGIIPLIYSNNNELMVANIGFGSGLSAQAILTNPNVKSLDTIEIEEKVFEAGKYFSPINDLAYNDNRSHFVIDDAKTFFASKNIKYDLILAEPPNPWVSGVASLFTQEWYAHVTKYLKNDGIYAQWIQAYELDTPLFSTIYRALRQEFKFVHVYTLSGDAEVVVIASNSEMTIKSDKLSDPTNKILKKIGINSLDDLVGLKYVAKETLLDDLFTAKELSLFNSDYFPVLDNGAAKARFVQSQVTDVPALAYSRFLQELYNNKYIFDKKSLQMTGGREYDVKDKFLKHRNKSILLADFLNNKVNESDLSNDDLELFSTIKNCKKQNADMVSKATNFSVLRAFSSSPSGAVKQVIDYSQKNCLEFLGDETKAIIEGIKAYLNHNDTHAIYTINTYLDKQKNYEKIPLFLVKLYLTASIRAGKFDNEKIKALYVSLYSRRMIKNDVELTVLFYRINLDM